MPRREDRAKRRQARCEEFRDAIRAYRDDPVKLWGVLLRIAGSPHRLWEVVRGLDLTPDEKAMVMRAVAPHLAEAKPPSVVLGPEFANRVPPRKKRA